MRLVRKIIFPASIFAVALAGSSLAVSTFQIKWGTHTANDYLLEGAYYYTTDSGFTKSLLKSLDAAGLNPTDLVDGTDLVEIGFFDTDLTNDNTSSTISPNTSSTDLFQGVWTPLSTKTKIGQNWNKGTLEDVPDGEFYFLSKFSDNDPSTESSVDWKVLHNDLSSNSLTIDDFLEYGSGSAADDNVVDDRVNALVTATTSPNTDTVPIGIRFYDQGSLSSGSTKYNTIMSTDWLLDWDSGNLVVDLLESDEHPTTPTQQVRTTLQFEFDNSDANTANLSKVGTGDNQVNSNDFVTTITYHDGTSALDASSASHILSGLDGSGAITVGNDHTLTLHANSGADRSFTSDIEASGGGNGATTLVKSGAGKQILSGDVRLAGTSSGWLNIDNGTLSLAGASGKVHTFEYLTGDPGTGGSLELNNTIVDTVEFGFANTTASQTFDGNVSLVGSGAENVIKIASGATGADYGKEQNMTGVVSGSNELVKDGVGRLVLKADNANTGGVEIKNGTLVVGNAANDADLGTGTINITKGKLEVLAGDSISNTVQGADASNKSMVGGDGTIATVAIGGDTTEITVVSPGQGISSSLSSETTLQQSSVGTGGSAELAMGDFTITSLSLMDGGVYDWEISDFSESAVAGTDFDVLKFNTLTFDSSGTFTINILGLQADGTPGPVAGSDGVHTAGLQNLWDDSWNNSSTKSGSYKGFKFLDGPSHGSITWGGVSVDGDGYVTNFFDVKQDGFAYHNNFWMGDWNVWYDGSGDFYLRFSAVPEPSTYVMVTGLLMVPGVSCLRRLRKRRENSAPREEL